MVSVTGIELCSWIMNAHPTISLQCGGMQYSHQVQEINVVFLRSSAEESLLLVEEDLVRREGAQCCLCWERCALYIKQ